MKKTLCLLLFILTALLSVSADARPVNRHILAVIDGSEIETEFNNLIFKQAEMPLNHLGFIVDYVDVTKRLPDDAEMAKYGGIISWFTDNQLKDPIAYAKWAIRQLAAQRKFVIIDEFGFSFDDAGEPTPPEVLEEFYKAFGISYDASQATQSPLLIEVVENDPEMTEFERKLHDDLTFFNGIRVVDRNSRVYLKLRRKDTGSIADAVFIHSKGAHVLPTYASYLNLVNKQTRWRIDPFRFFALAFGADFPKPDVSTINGMRLFYSHIDGDGIRNLSHVRRGTPCGELAYEFLRNLNLPVSVSVVVGDIISVTGGERDRLTGIVKRIFALPGVEPASHGWAHPYKWREKDRELGIRLRGYEYSPKNEIGNSIDYINDNLVPEGKETDIFFWTGDCRPDYEAVKYVHDNDIQNLNGGDTRFDNDFSSYAYVAPLFNHVDGLLQNFSAGSNENIYTNDWTGPFYGYKYVIETFKRTESPIRIRPIDIYYHFYTMEHQVAIDALGEAYAWAASQDVAPSFASDYIKTLKGFLTTGIEMLSPGRWAIVNNGDLRTVRFDGSRANVDLERSRGVIGFLHHQGSLYVHLDNGERSEVQLSAARPSRPYLVKASGRIKDWLAMGGSARFKIRSIGSLRFVLGGLAAGRKYRVTMGDKSFDVSSDKNGDLSVSKELADKGFNWISISASVSP